MPGPLPGHKPVQRTMSGRDVQKQGGVRRPWACWGLSLNNEPQHQNQLQEGGGGGAKGLATVREVITVWSLSEVKTAPGACEGCDRFLATECKQMERSSCSTTGVPKAGTLGGAS